MPKRDDIKTILVIGSGPIIIGQAAEFDYAGTQACLALKEEQLPDGVHEFVSSTFDVINENDIIKLASMFTFGRENIIPDMFINIVEELEKSSTSKLSQFIFYLKRHIELDAGKHQDICFLMLSKVCKNNSANWEVATSAAYEALKARLKFWDSIYSNIVS